VEVRNQRKLIDARLGELRRVLFHHLVVARRHGINNGYGGRNGLFGLGRDLERRCWCDSGWFLVSFQTQILVEFADKNFSKSVPNLHLEGAGGPTQMVSKFPNCRSDCSVALTRLLYLYISALRAGKGRLTRSVCACVIGRISKAPNHLSTGNHPMTYTSCHSNITSLRDVMAEQTSVNAYKFDGLTNAEVQVHYMGRVDERFEYGAVGRFSSNLIVKERAVMPVRREPILKGRDLVGETLWYEEKDAVLNDNKVLEVKAGRLGDGRGVWVLLINGKVTRTEFLWQLP